MVTTTSGRTGTRADTVGGRGEYPARTPPTGLCCRRVHAGLDLHLLRSWEALRLFDGPGIHGPPFTSRRPLTSIRAGCSPSSAD